ncbi:MAG: futalosine hydrolase [Bacteroidetes bacterium]|nr:futalosine hydrolase [Bacteroidota bacterium]
MKISIVAATELEIIAIKGMTFPAMHQINFVVHGVGILSASYHLQNIALQKPDYIIQCGIAGAFDKTLNLGETVVVASEFLGDLGAEDHDHILDVVELGLADPNAFPYTNNGLLNSHIPEFVKLKKVNAITVQMTSGNALTIAKRLAKYQAQIESMEGAALHYIGLQNSIPFIQFRGISNYVEPRNRSSWKIKEAISNCQQEVISFINQLPS